MRKCVTSCCSLNVACRNRVIGFFPLGQEDPLVENGEAVLVVIFTLLLVCLVMHFIGGGKIGGLQLKQDHM